MTIDNPKIYKLLKEKKELVEAGRELDKKMEKEAEEQEKRISKIKRIEETVSEIIKKTVHSKLPEFEEPRRIKITDDNQIDIEIVNVIDEFKEKYLKAQQENIKTEKENGVS